MSEYAEEKGLSERELEILRLVATGASNKQIARQLVISTNTVKVHLRNIFAKTNVVSRTEATLYAIREGLVQVGEAVVSPELSVEAATSVAEEGTTPVASGLVMTEESRPQREWWRNGRIAVLAVAVVAALLLAVGAAAFSWGQATPAPTPTPNVAAVAAASTPVSRWRVRAPMLTARSGLAVAAYEGRIYAIAGEGAQGPTAAVERYDPTADAWTVLSPKPLPVADVSAAVVGGRIYVPGGRLEGGTVTSTLEVYDPARDAWERRSPLPVAVSAYALVAFEGKLYLFGGWDGAGYLASVYEYDPGRDTWTVRSPMPTARAYAGAAMAGGKVYVMGGYDGAQALAVNEEYLPERDNGKESPWERRTPLPVGRYGLGATSVADMIHIVGGAGGATTLQPLKYFPRQDEWQPFEGPVAQAGMRLGLVLLETQLYGLGGQLEGASLAQNQTYQAIYTVAVPVVQ